MLRHTLTLLFVTAIGATSAQAHSQRELAQHCVSLLPGPSAELEKVLKEIKGWSFLADGTARRMAIECLNGATGDQWDYDHHSSSFVITVLKHPGVLTEEEQKAADLKADLERKRLEKRAAERAKAEEQKRKAAERRAAEEKLEAERRERMAEIERRAAERRQAVYHAAAEACVELYHRDSVAALTNERCFEQFLISGLPEARGWLGGTK